MVCHRVKCWNNLKNELLTRNIQVKAPSSWNNSESHQGFGTTCRPWCHVSRPLLNQVIYAYNIILIICSFVGWKRDDVSSCKRCFSEVELLSCELPTRSFQDVVMRTSLYINVNKTLLWWHVDVDVWRKMHKWTKINKGHIPQKHSGC